MFGLFKLESFYNYQLKRSVSIVFQNKLEKLDLKIPYIFSIVVEISFEIFILMRLFLMISIGFVVLFSGIVFFVSMPGYKSAFEADQQCHFKLEQLSADFSTIGCDHDLETRQWLLFESDQTGKPANVLERFKY